MTIAVELSVVTEHETDAGAAGGTGGVFVTPVLRTV